MISSRWGYTLCFPQEKAFCTDPALQVKGRGGMCERGDPLLSIFAVGSEP